MNQIVFFEACIDEMGGVERVISTLANSLASEYKVKVISLYKTRPTPFFTYDERIERIYLRNDLKSKKYNKKNIMYYIYKIAEKIYYKTIINYKKKKLAQKINKNDILIFGRISMAVEWIPKYLSKNPIIIRDASHFYCHNNDEQGKIINILENYADLFIVSSDESKKVYIDLLKNNRCKIEKIYNPLGIDANRGYNFNNKRIIAVGRCDFQKGYDVLIKAFSIVMNKHSDWNLEIVGNYDNQLKKIVDELGLKKNVILTKECKNIVEKLNNSSIYITTSRFEGYANSLVEAVACGVPSITTDWLLGANEIIKDKENGRIIKLQDRFKYAEGTDNYVDVENIANTIIELIENPKECEKYSKKSKEIIETRDKKIIINIWKNKIEGLIKDVNKKN